MDLATAANIAQIVSIVPLGVGLVRWIAGKQPAPSGRRNAAAAKSPQIPKIVWIAIIGLVISGLISAASLAERLKWLPSQGPEQSFNTTFKNRDVILDNHEYIDCTFENVNFVYGGGYFRIDRPHFVGDQTIVANSKTVGGAFVLAQMLGLLDVSKIKGIGSRGPFPEGTQ